MKLKKFVINLDKRPDRLQEFFSRYIDMDVERFSAIDGRHIHLNNSFSDIDKFLFSILDNNLKHNPGILGCWSSHVNLWETLKNSDDYDAFVIFEDDVFFVSGFKEKFELILNEINEETDIIYFGGRFSPDFVPRNVNSEWEKVGNFYFYKGNRLGREVDRTTHGYIITKNGAKNVLSVLYSSTFLPALDGWLNHRRFDLALVDFFPHIAWSPINYKTDIQGQRI